MPWELARSAGKPPYLRRIMAWELGRSGGKAQYPLRIYAVRTRTPRRQGAISARIMPWELARSGGKPPYPLRIMPWNSPAAAARRNIRAYYAVELARRGRAPGPGTMP
jgi:hypothetical protein